VYVPYQRDPVSVPFDAKAADLIRRAYAVKGSWAGDYLSPPGPRARAWAASIGIDLYERDRWGELRYIRAYKRSVFWILSNYGGVGGLRGQQNLGHGRGGWHAPVRGEWQTGLRVERPEWTSARWAVRFRIHAGGSATSRIGLVRAQRLGENWMDADGHPTFRQSTPDDRDY
jgi:hypothetical protein